MSPQPPSTPEFIRRVEAAAADWQAAIAPLSEAEALQPGPGGAWPVKDLAAHLTWHLREMVGLLRARALVGSPMWAWPTDERNAAIYAEHQAQAWPEAQADFGRALAEVLAELAALAPDDLQHPERFAGFPPDWGPWQVLADNTYEHLAVHAAEVRARFGA